MKTTIVKKIGLSAFSAILLAGSLNANSLSSGYAEEGQLKTALVKLIKKVDKIEKEISYLKSKKNERRIFKHKERKQSNLESQSRIDYAHKKYKRSAVRGSYINYKHDKTFRINSTKVREYELPVLSAKRYGSGGYLTKGSYVVADKYTKAGWVHLKNGGWVKGFLVYPKVLQK